MVWVFFFFIWLLEGDEVLGKSLIWPKNWSPTKWLKIGVQVVWVYIRHIYFIGRGVFLLRLVTIGPHSFTVSIQKKIWNETLPKVIRNSLGDRSYSQEGSRRAWEGLCISVSVFGVNVECLWVSVSMNYNILYHIILYFIILYYIIFYYIILFYIILYYIILY